MFILFNNLLFSQNINLSYTLINLHTSHFQEIDI